jgi:hypothetical protein
VEIRGEQFISPSFGHGRDRRAEPNVFPPFAEGASAADSIDLKDALVRGADHPLSAKARLSAGADEARAKVAQRQSAWPTVGLFGYAERTDALASLDTPLGD